MGPGVADFFGIGEDLVLDLASHRRFLEKDPRVIRDMIRKITDGLARKIHLPQFRASHPRLGIINLPVTYDLSTTMAQERPTALK